MAQNRTNVPLLTFLWGVSSGSERRSRVAIGCLREGALSAFGALLSVRAEVADGVVPGALYHPLTSVQSGTTGPRYRRFWVHVWASRRRCSVRTEPALWGGRVWGPRHELMR